MYERNLFLVFFFFWTVFSLPNKICILASSVWFNSCSADRQRGGIHRPVWKCIGSPNSLFLWNLRKQTVSGRSPHSDSRSSQYIDSHSKSPPNVPFTGTCFYIKTRESRCSHSTVRLGQLTSLTIEGSHLAVLHFLEDNTKTQDGLHHACHSKLWKQFEELCFKFQVFEASKRGATPQIIQCAHLVTVVC